MNRSNQELIDTLNECVRACEVCATACLNEDDIDMMTECIRMDRDCADVCSLSARLIARESAVGTQLLLLCEEICRLCADNCSAHDQMDHCRDCAEACVRCADACHAHHTAIEQV